MKTKIITLLAVMGIAATALLISYSEKSVTQDPWQSQSVSQELSGLYDTSASLLADITSRPPAPRSDEGLSKDTQAIENAVASLVDKSDAFGQMEASEYYKVKPSEDSMLVLIANPYEYAEFVKINGTPKYAGIIRDLTDGKSLKLSKEDIVNDKEMLIVEKISLLMILAASNTPVTVPLTRGRRLHGTISKR